jgi:serine/threonine protein phosphatase PrpC
MSSSSTAAMEASPHKRDPRCPYYGCPKKPHDVHYNYDAVKVAFQKIRDTKRIHADRHSVGVLQESIATDAVTLTLIGYKGGQLTDQINQDRAVIVSPYYITTESSSSSNAAIQQERILMGVFDGHAPRGEQVSEFAATELPPLLAAKLRNALEHCSSPEDIMKQTANMLSETFIELDQRVPADPSGGCTATVVLRQGSKIYVANAGDSRSFIVAYRPSTMRCEIVYMTREDKPNLPEEKARVEAAGGQVYIPIRGTSRVVYQDPETMAPTGLAMSRSIGDWAAGKMGVIPDPIVHVLDIPTIVATEMEGYQVENDGSVRSHEEDDDVYIFAISATDGMMDYLDEGDIAKILAHSLFEATGVHPISACEHLVFAAAQAWQQAKQGRYRDDISIAVTALRRPPTPASQ